MPSSSRRSWLRDGGAAPLFAELDALAAQYGPTRTERRRVNTEGCSSPSGCRGSAARRYSLRCPPIRQWGQKGVGGLAENVRRR